MKFSKTTKKLNTHLLTALDIMCEKAKNELDGFVKLDHTVQFDLFPSSLLVTCYFENQACLIAAKPTEILFQKELHKLLFKKGIVLKTPRLNLAFSLTE